MDHDDIDDIQDWTDEEDDDEFDFDPFPPEECDEHDPIESPLPWEGAERKPNADSVSPMDEKTDGIDE